MSAKQNEQSLHCSFCSLHATGVTSGTDEHEPFTHPLNDQTQTAAKWGAQFYPISNTASKHNAYILNNEVNIRFVDFKVNSQHTQ
jgi:hypothetical protein